MKVRHQILIWSIVLASFFPTSLYADSDRWGPGMMGRWGMHSWPFFGQFWWVALIGLGIAGITIAAVLLFMRRTVAADVGTTHLLHILKERLAKGEITAEEYDSLAKKMGETGKSI